MPDISTGQNFTTGMTVTAPIMTNIIGMASINSSFVSTKSVKSTLSSNDSIPLVDNGGNFWRITGATLADGLVNAEPNFARIAVGQLQTVNTIINGDMQIMQRGNSFAQVNTPLYALDRWKINMSAGLTGRTTVTQNALELTQTANYPHTKYSSRFTVNTTQSSLAAGDFLTYSTKVERQFARPLFDGVHSFSLVLQSTVTGTFCAFIRDAGATKSYIMECVVTSANVPQRFTFPNIAALQGTLGSLDTDAAYEIGVCLGAGATFQGGSSGSWLTGSFVADANQINFLNNAAATLDITLLQHELGAICTPFFYQPFDLSLNKCRRYFFSTYQYGTYPGNATFTGTLKGQWITTTVFYPFIGRLIPVKQRAAVTSACYSPNSGTINKVWNVTGSADIAFSSTANESDDDLLQIVTGATTAGNTGAVQIVKDADF